MRHQNFRAAYLWRLKDNVRGAGVFAGVMIAVYALIACGIWMIGRDNASEGGMFAAWSFSACIMTFVFGIVTIRDDMRLMNQFGTGRGTIFAANITAAITVCAIVALAGELYNGIGGAVAGAQGSFYITDFYALMYCDGAPLDFAGHAASFAFALSFLILAYATGMILSMSFYRLPKLGKILLAIALPTVFLNGAPMLVLRFVDGPAIVNFMMAMAGNWIAVNILIAVLLAGGAYFLFRRAPIRAVKR